AWHGSTDGRRDFRARLSGRDGRGDDLCGARDPRQPGRRSRASVSRPAAPSMTIFRPAVRRRAYAALAVLIALVAAAIVVPPLAPTDPRAIGNVLALRFIPPLTADPLGTGICWARTRSAAICSRG